MKINLKKQLMDLLKESELLSPKVLSESLEISPQALHRHIKTMINDGVLEAVGSPPYTQYRLAGVPLLSPSINWVLGEGEGEKSADFLCETRDVFSARIASLKYLLKNGLPIEELSLIISVAGELGNNSFDHNLGKWRDTFGCWYEHQVSGGVFWLVIADRGQGIFNSIKVVKPQIKNDDEALNVAFNESLSGRSPEQRGNGLKYVKKNILGSSDRGLICASGFGRISYGVAANECELYLNKFVENKCIPGTLTLIYWRIKK